MMLTIGERIKLMREKEGLTQEELATKLGYKSRSSINKIELGQSDLPQTKIAMFAKALNTTPAYLMGWEHKSVDGYISDLLKRIREWNNLSLDDVCAKLDGLIPCYAVKNLENSAIPLDYSIFQEYCGALGFDIVAILEQAYLEQKYTDADTGYYDKLSDEEIHALSQQFVTKEGNYSAFMTEKTIKIINPSEEDYEIVRKLIKMSSAQKEKLLKLIEVLD